MTFDPYNELGVPREASTAEIKSAYRNAAKHHHPDKGGDRAKFERITHAHLILTSPSRRQRYDDTGDTDAGPDNHVIMVVQVVVQSILKVLQLHAQHGIEPEHIVDLMNHVKRSIRDDIAATEKNKLTLEATAAKVEKAVARLSRKLEDNKPDMVRDALKGFARQNREGIDKANSNVSLFREALILADQYSYDAILQIQSSAGYSVQTFKVW